MPRHAAPMHSAYHGMQGTCGRLYRCATLHTAVAIAEERFCRCHATQHPCIVHIRGCRAHVADSIDVRHCRQLWLSLRSDSVDATPTQHPCTLQMRARRAHVADSIDVRHLQTAVAIAEERFCRCHAHPAPMHSAYHRSMGESRSMGGVEVHGGGSRCMGGSRWCMGEHRSSTSGTPSALNPCTSPSSQFPSPSSFT